MRDERRLKLEQARGVWGHAPPGKFLKLGALRSLLRPCLSQNATGTSPPPVVSAARRMNQVASNQTASHDAHVRPCPICALVSRSSIAIEN